MEAELDLLKGIGDDPLADANPFDTSVTAAQGDDGDEVMGPTGGETATLKKNMAMRRRRLELANHVI